ncbi:MAG TPA: cytidylate kinase-like family protein [Dehalococcoidia bacterium]
MTETQRRVIAISRAIGAGGEEIGRMVAAQLGLRYADNEVIARAAEKAGVSSETVAKAESSPGLVERILESLGKVPFTGETMAFTPVLVEAPVAYSGLIEQVLREAAAQGDVVIVGHAASIPLSGTSGLLRVLVMAPAETRVSRLAQAEGMDAGKARKALRHSDDERRSYLRRFYSVDEERPDHYDLVVSTESVTYEAAARTIVAAAG